MQPPILTVSQLNKQVKHVLEYELGVIHVEGEVSNLTKPSSGHYYFTLKDTAAQIRCVFFKNRHSFPATKQLTDGQLIVAIGRLSLYEARGDYQLIVEKITESGLGALFQQFELLKKRLAAEGLFDAGRKKTLPKIPSTIGIITSPHGAALQDILSTLARRFPIASIIIYPSEVQGETAPIQLIKALDYANKHRRCDVLILARGGGSLEDLWAFNHEQLARTIANSAIPIVTGVGHETDFTIADFVSDYRAETPTGAATAVTPDSLDLNNQINSYALRLNQAIIQKLHQVRIRFTHLSDKLTSPAKTIANFWQTLDYLETQLMTGMTQYIIHKKHQVQLGHNQIIIHNPKIKLFHTKERLKQLVLLSTQHMHAQFNQCKNRLLSDCATLNAVSPLATLERGYAIASKNGTIITNSRFIKRNDRIDVRLAEGNIECEVLKIHD